MKLQIYFNGTLYNELHLDEHDFYTRKSLSWEKNVRRRYEKVETYRRFIRQYYARQIASADRWEIVLKIPKGKQPSFLETIKETHLEQSFRENQEAWK